MVTTGASPPAMERGAVPSPREAPNRRLRVLSAIVVPPHLSASGGARAAEQLSASVAAHCDVTIASMMPGGPPSPNPEAQPKRLPVTTDLPSFMPWSRLPRGARSLFYRSDIPSLIRRERFNLVHIHNPMPAFEFARVARACRREKVPYVISTHGFNEIANGERIYAFDAARRLVWRLCVSLPVTRAVRGASGIFALSPADVQIVRAMGFRGPIVQVPNGVPSPAAPDPDRDARLCAECGIPPTREPGQITYMFLANHTPNKGLPVLFEAMARIEAPCLMIVGGETRDGVPYEAAMRLCRPDRRIVVTGRLSDEACAALMRRSDVFVFPTLADTFPLVVLEAMAHGLPVIASDLGGIPYQLGRCGLLVPPGDAAALARSIDEMASDEARRRFMGRSARARVASLFTWEKAAERAVDGYGAVMARERVVPEPARPTLRSAPSFPR